MSINQVCDIKVSVKLFIVISKGYCLKIFTTHIFFSDFISFSKIKTALKCYIER